jgi:hypothetical protein
MTEKCVYYFPFPSIFPIAIFLNHFIDFTKFLEQTTIALDFSLLFSISVRNDISDIKMHVHLIVVTWGDLDPPYDADEGLQKLGLCLVLMAFEERVIFIVPHMVCCDMGPRFSRSHPKDSPIQLSLTTR